MTKYLLEKLHFVTNLLYANLFYIYLNKKLFIRVNYIQT